MRGEMNPHEMVYFIACQLQSHGTEIVSRSHFKINVTREKRNQAVSLTLT